MTLSAVMPDVAKVVGEDELVHEESFDFCPIFLLVLSVDVALEQSLLRGVDLQRVHNSFDL